jgi:hypothetical protein
VRGWPWGQGAASEAINILLSAVERARANRQFAAEVICLQTASQFGDHSSGPRFASSRRSSRGPRVGLAAWFTEALRNGDAAELSTVSEDFERMGNLVAAVDAAAHAAVAYCRLELRGSALGCITRAEALAEQCGSADNLALCQAREPLPLTDRESEIVMLFGPGPGQPRGCRATDPFGSHCRRPHLQGDEQDRNSQPGGLRSATARTQAADPRIASRLSGRPSV